jgi:hypothetical protein
MAAAPVKLGPGTLKIGATGSEIDVSCQINNAVISADKDEGDSITKLCGDVVPGAVTYTFSLAGNIDVDVDNSAGIFALSQSAPGSHQDFTFVPNTAAATEAAGILVLDPLDFGGDEAGTYMTSDFEFSLVGSPSFTYGTGATADAGETVAA